MSPTAAWHSANTKRRAQKVSDMAAAGRRMLKYTAPHALLDTGEDAPRRRQTLGHRQICGTTRRFCAT
jgi:hypothetical protein